MAASKTDHRLSLEQTAARMIAQLSDNYKQKLAAFRSDHGVLTVATMCSGTDVAVLAVKALLAELNQADLGSGRSKVSMRHVFSCERAAAARKFILKFAPPELLFCEASELSGSSALDAITNSLQVVPAVDLLIAGFVCKDVSRLNTRKREDLGVVAEGRGKTGSTFEAIFRYCELRRPQYVIMENVASIDDKGIGGGGTNGEAVVQKFEGIGYIVITRRLSPQQHGVPHRRMRLWFVAFCVAYRRIDAPLMEQTAKQRAAFREALAMLNIDPPRLAEFLLPEGGPELSAWQSRRARCSGGKEVGAGWKSVHEQYFRGRGFRYPPELPCLYAEHELKRLECLPQRAQEIVALLDLTGSPLQPLEEEAVDVSQSLERVPRCKEAVPCLLPHGTVWLRARRRLLEPPEALGLQSLPPVPRDALEDFSNAELYSLAGNAFCGANCMAVLLAALAAWESRA